MTNIENKKKRRIPYGKHHITDEDIDAVIKVLKSDFLTQGPMIKQFEEAFANYVGSKYAVAVANGTAALHLSAIALGVTSGQKVITTPITFAASANCVRYCDGEVIFSDIDKKTYTIDLYKFEKLLQDSPIGTFAGVIPVDFSGFPVNSEELKTIADKYGLWIMEDACHAPGAYFNDAKGRRQLSGNGKFSNLTIFSFHPVKHIATGEGGMITTNNKTLHEKLCLLRTHGITKDPEHLMKNDGNWYYEMQELGYNYRLTDIQAALGLSQLQIADSNLKKRRELARRYNEAFQDNDLILGQSGYHENHAYHLYIIEVENRLELYNFLRTKGIYAQVHYIPVHLMPYYRQYGWKEGDFPVAEQYYERCLSLPMYPTLTNEEQEYVIEMVFEGLKK
jgi:hypothetical protein